MDRKFKENEVDNNINNLQRHSSYSGEELHIQNMSEKTIVSNEYVTYERKRTVQEQIVPQPSPTIVITCPADRLPPSLFCQNCDTGRCCQEQCSDDCLSTCSSSRSVPGCVDCGASVSSRSSDYSTYYSGSECETQEYELGENNSHKQLKKYASYNRINEEVLKNSDQELFSDDSSSTISNSSDEVIYVGIGGNISNPEASIDGFHDGENVYSNKESEILEQVMDQVETYPPEEDLDVILEIVGEEDETSTRSELNLRDCSDKFKEIYSQKLRQIYNNKNRELRMSKYSNLVRGISDEFINRNSTIQKSGQDLKTNEDNNLDSLETSSTCSTLTRKSSNEGSIIESLPEIRKFHPENLDRKMSIEDKTYLKATSLIDEIENCFMETAYLVEKTIGGETPSTKILHNNNFENTKSISTVDRMHNEYEEHECAEKRPYVFQKNKLTNDEDQINQSSVVEIINDKDHFIEMDSFHEQTNKIINDAELPSMERSINTGKIFTENELSGKNIFKPISNYTLTSSSLVLNSEKKFKQQKFTENKYLNRCKSTTDLVRNNFDDLDYDYLKFKTEFDSFSNNEYSNKSNNINQMESPPVMSVSMSEFCHNDDKFFSSKYNYHSLPRKLSSRSPNNTVRNFTNTERKNKYNSVPQSDDVNRAANHFKNEIFNEQNASTNDKEVLKIKRQITDHLKANEDFYKDNDYKINKDMFQSDLALCDAVKLNNRWKSEPNFDTMTSNIFPCQSNLNEEYFNREYLTSSVTSTVYKNTSTTDYAPILDPSNFKQDIHTDSDNPEVVKNTVVTNYTPFENEKNSSTCDTIGILNQQPLFAQIDHLLRGLQETGVDTPCESDEGVVSNHSEACYAATDTVAADEELERDVEQISKGINAIKEKHLGHQIEKEIEERVRASSEGIKSLIYTEHFLREQQMKLAKRSETLVRKRNFETFDDFMLKLNNEIDNLTKLSDVDPYSEIARICEELKTMELKGGDTNYPGCFYESQNTNNFVSKRLSRHEIFENETYEGTNCHIIKKRSSSLLSYFEKTNEDGQLEDKNECKTVGDEMGEPEDDTKSYVLRTLHNNLRYYVITLAILEKLLQDNSDLGDACSSLIMKEMGASSLQCENNLALLNSGNEAFLHGLQRQHNLQMLNN